MNDNAMLFYAVKRVIRSIGLFASLLLGVVLASTFFAGVNIGADTTAKAALYQQLDNASVDIVVGEYSSRPLTSTEWMAAAQKVAQVSGIARVEVISRAYWYGNLSDKGYFSLIVAGLSANASTRSRVYDGLTVTSGASSLGANETYVFVSSRSSLHVELNETLALNFTYEESYRDPPVRYSFVVTLKVAGFVELSDTAYNIASGEYSRPMLNRPEPVQKISQASFEYDLLLVDWQKTTARILDETPSSVPSYGWPVRASILAYLKRDALINPWDIPGSVEAVRAITDQVSQRVAEYGIGVQNNVEEILLDYVSTSTMMRFAFLGVALPVFFVAWYVGSAVSDVSYNLRRREIGLLLTKGFSTGQLFGMFLTESLLIGIVGGLAGLGLGFLFSPLFTVTSSGQQAVGPVLSSEVVVMSIIFSLVITLLSTFRSSRRASKLPAIDALREYMYVEEVKPYKQRLPWIAFLFGSYKMVMFILGIDLYRSFMGRPMPSGNIILVILFGIWIVFDGLVLNAIGPLLFFWGFTKIFIRGSLMFQELVTRAAKFLGDLGTLATRNVRRNPARAASVAFLIALITGYSFQTVGALASEQDFIVRDIKASIGADVSVQLISAANASRTINETELMPAVASTALEISFSAPLPSQYYSLLQIRAVDPDRWLSTAYYEDEWFRGNSTIAAFHQMKLSNQTIILDTNTANYLGRGVGDNVTLVIGSSTRQLSIVGLFGPEVAQGSYDTGQLDYATSKFWSYVPLGFYASIHDGIYPLDRLLVRLKPSADGKATASEIRQLENVSYVRSLAEELESYHSDLTRMGTLNIQRVGIIFSILAASIATGLVTSVSMQERRREASIMNARGLSFKQLVTMFLAENLAIVVFSAVLGIVVGLIVLRGNVSALNTASSYPLVMHRIVLPLDSVALLSFCQVLIFVSALVPVVLLTRRYLSKVERIVRL